MRANTLRWLVALCAVGGCSSGSSSASNGDGGSDCSRLCQHITTLGCAISNCVSDCMKQLTEVEVACSLAAPTCTDVLNCALFVSDLATPVDMSVRSDCVTIKTSTVAGSAALGISCQAGSDCQSEVCATIGPNDGYCTIACTSLQGCAQAVGTSCKMAPSGTSYCVLAMNLCP